MSSINPAPLLLAPAHSLVLDASFVVALCAKEPHRYAHAQNELRVRVAAGCDLHAPNVLAAEATFVLCSKMQNTVLTPADYAIATQNLHALLSIVEFPTGGDAPLLPRADVLRAGYGCSHCADGLYIALAETLAPCELLTFDTGQKRQAAGSVGVTVTVLTP